MYNNKWYLSTSLISLCFALWFLMLPLIVGLILLNIQRRYNQKIEQLFIENEIEDIENIRKTRDNLEMKINDLNFKKENLVKKLDVLDESEKIFEERGKLKNELNEIKKKKVLLLNEINIIGEIKNVSEQREKVKKELEELNKKRVLLFFLNQLNSISQTKSIVEEKEKQQAVIDKLNIQKENLIIKLNLIDDFEAIVEEREKVKNELKILVNQKEVLLEKLNLIDEVDKMYEAKEKLNNEINNLYKTRDDLLERINVLNDVDQIQQIKEHLETEIQNLNQVIKEKNEEIIVLDDEILYQSFGFYNPKYNLENSEAYKVRLDNIRKIQKEIVKQSEATIHHDNWSLNGSVSQGRKMNKDNIKMTIYSFNNECDMAISKVKFNNIESMEKRIKSSYNKLNKMNEKNNITIKQEYLDLKLEELYLAYEYEQKIQEEKEEQRLIREQMREEERVRKEIEAAKAKIEKEEKHFKQEIEALNNRLVNSNDKEKLKLEQKIKELEFKLALVEKDKENVFQREQNTRAGYVYIISNIGSFGENVYKIGMTRRLEPNDRVRELGDASVPFYFDVHAMIFSEDAPALENALHKAFQHRRVNKVNLRREFFNVSLQEIEYIVKKNHNAVVEFTKLAEAELFMAI